jgi:enterochelin esterase family protein
VEVPEQGVDFYDVKDVSHGEVRARWYHARTTDAWRRAYVYTPPDYDTNTGARYPVLYLQHGAGAYYSVGVKVHPARCRAASY